MQSGVDALLGHMGCGGGLKLVECQSTTRDGGSDGTKSEVDLKLKWFKYFASQLDWHHC